MSRKYLNERNPKRGDDPIEQFGNKLYNIGKTPWLLFSLLIFSTTFFIIHASITGLSIESSLSTNTLNSNPYTPYALIGISIFTIYLIKKHSKK